MSDTNIYNEDEFTRVLRHANQRYNALLQQSRGAYGTKPSIEGEALHELAAALEELNVTSEELRAQNEALRDAYYDVEMERSHYEQLFTLMPDAYIVTDAHATVLEANAAAEQLFRAADERLRGKPLALFIAEEDRRAFRDELSNMRREDVALELSAMVSSRSGSPVRVLIRASRIQDRSPHKRYGWMIRDMTEKQRVTTLSTRFAEEQSARIEAERAARRFRMLAEASRQLTATADIDAVCDGVAKAVVKYGADHCEILLLEGMQLKSAARINREQRQAPFAEALRRRHNMSVDVESSLVWQAIRTNEIQTSPPVSPDASQTYRDVSAAVRTLGPRHSLALPLSVPGRTFGVMVVMGADPIPALGVEDMGVLVEIATRASLAISNAMLFHELELANREKSDFLAILSHELRTPLTAVIGYSDLLLGGIPDVVTPRARDHVERIRSCSWHQLTVIEQILHYARLDASGDQPLTAEGDVRSLVDEAVTIVQGVASSKPGISLSVDLPTVIPPLRTDAGRLRQIIVNLLTNAFKFTDAGGVSLAVRHDDDNIYFSVADTGIGMAAEEVQHVFEPFWRANRSDAGLRGGTGLGMTVSQRLARSLGAEITLRSEKGVGTIFTLRLPLR